VRETLYRDLGRPASELQDKRVLDFAQSQVGRIRFERDGKTFEIEKNGESWELRAPASGKVAAFKVSAILYTLERLRALKFDTSHPGKTELKIRGLDPSRSTLTLQTKDGADLDALSIGKESPTDPKQWFVMGKRAERIDLIDATELASLPKAPEDLN
jgi:hypothetical protein